VHLLDPFKKRSQELGSSVALQPQRGCDATYYHGEKLVIEVSSAPKPLQHVYVDYYAADREMMVHMIPNLKQPENLYKDLGSVTIGTNREMQWQILPPFGMELVTVITSAQPLIIPPRRAPERAAAYIEELRKVLPPDPANTDIAATYCFITSADK
jgi:hypothetical protein